MYAYQTLRKQAEATTTSKQNSRETQVSSLNSVSREVFKCQRRYKFSSCVKHHIHKTKQKQTKTSKNKQKHTRPSANHHEQQVHDRQKHTTITHAHSHSHSQKHRQTNTAESQQDAGSCLLFPQQSQKETTKRHTSRRSMERNPR